MVTEVKEVIYRGILLVRVKNDKQSGWKIVLDKEEYIFPFYVSATAAIDEFIEGIIPKHKGKKFKKDLHIL